MTGITALASFLRAEMNASGWTQADLAIATDLPRQTINNLLQERVKQPDLETLARLAEGLDVSLAVLVEKLGYSLKGNHPRRDPRVLRDIDRELAVLRAHADELAQRPTGLRELKEAVNLVRFHLSQPPDAVAETAAHGKRRA